MYKRSERKECLRRGIYARGSVNNFRATCRPGVDTRRSSIDRPSCAINPLIANYRSITVERERASAWERDGERERGRVMNAGLVSAAMMETDTAAGDDGSATCNGGRRLQPRRSEKCAGRPLFRIATPSPPRKKWQPIAPVPSTRRRDAKAAAQRARYR